MDSHIWSYPTDEGSMNVVNVVSDLIVWVVTGIFGGFLEAGRRLNRSIARANEKAENNRKQIEEVREHFDLDTKGPSRIQRVERDINGIGRTLDRHEQYWTGDPDDPARQGALDELHEINEKLDRDDRDRGS